MTEAWEPVGTGECPQCGLTEELFTQDDGAGPLCKGCIDEHQWATRDDPNDTEEEQ